MAKKTTYYDYLRQELGDLIEQLQLPELYKQSLKRRWLDQVVWADKKAAECRRWHYRLRLTTIIGSVILPALVGINFQLGKDNPVFRSWFPYVPFALSQVIAISAAIEEFCRFGDRWRDYRQMAEDLKAEGWQYLQLSGPYQFSHTSLRDRLQATAKMNADTKDNSSSLQIKLSATQPTTHLKSYSTFADRVESIIKKDVQNYVSELLKQQAKQEQEIEKYLESAQAVTTDKTLFTQVSPDRRSPGTLPTNANSFPVVSDGATLDVSTINASALETPNLGLSASSTFGSAADLVVPPTNSLPTVNRQVAVPVPAPLNPNPAPVAPPVLTPLMPPIEVAPPVPVSSPPVAPPVLTPDLSAAIAAAANDLRGMSTAEGPDGGNQACAWTVNQVLQKAGIPPLGTNYVPDVLNVLKQGRGRLVSRQEAKAGDLVIAYQEEHIGIGLTNGCTRVLSNSSSNARFIWESDTDFDGYYHGESTIYRLIH